MTLITQNKLIQEHGWNLKLIEKYLPYSDSLVTNPQKPNYPMMKLFDWVRVQNIMCRKDFKADLQIMKERSKKIQETKRLKKALSLKQRQSPS
jgi:hypothetical protein